MLRSHLLPLFHLLQDPGLEDTADIKRVSFHHKQLWKQCQRHSVLCCLGNSKSHRRGKLVYHTYLSHLSITLPFHSLFAYCAFSSSKSLSHTHTLPTPPAHTIRKDSKAGKGQGELSKLKENEEERLQFFLKKKSVLGTMDD